MSTYPSVKISEILNKKIESEFTISPKIFINGYSSRGPIDKVYEIRSLKEFENFFGLPQTDNEYNFYRSAENVFNGGGILDFFRIDYSNQIDYNNNQAVNYYVNLNENDNLEDLFDKEFDVEETEINYIKKAFKYEFNKLLSEIKVFDFNLSNDDNYSHRIEIKSKFNNRIAINTNNEIDSKSKFKSLGVCPVFIGSINKQMFNTGYLGLEYIIDKLLDVKLNSLLLNSDIKNNILEKLNYTLNLDKIYSDIIEVIINSSNQNHTNFLSLEFLIDDNFEIYVEVLEFFSGVITDNLYFSDDNLFRLINNNSKIFEILLYDNSDNLVDHISNENEYTYFKFGDFNLFGDYSNLKDFSIYGEDSYLYQEYKTKDSVWYKHIQKLNNSYNELNRIYDYVIPMATEKINLISLEEFKFRNGISSYKLYVINGEPVMVYDLDDITTGIKLVKGKDDETLAFLASILNNDGEKDIYMRISKDDFPYVFKNEEPIYINGTGDNSGIYEFYANDEDFHIKLIVEIDEIDNETIDLYKPLEYIEFDIINDSNRLWINNDDYVIENIEYEDDLPELRLIDDDKIYRIISKIVDDELILIPILDVIKTKNKDYSDCLYELYLHNESGKIFRFYIKNGEITLHKTIINVDDNMLIIPHSNNLESYSKFEFDNDLSECCSLFNIFTVLDKDTTIFIDIPLNLNYKINEIIDNNRKMEMALNLEISSLLENELNIYDEISKFYDDPNFKNFFFINNHQYVDRFDNIEQDDYVIVKPSSEIIYPYTFADLFRYAVPLAQSISKEYLNCHSSITKTNRYSKEVFKILLEQFRINSIETDNNNNSLINHQIIRNSPKSIFSQHHAFRLFKYLKQHLRLVCNKYKFDLNTNENRQRLYKEIDNFVYQYKNNNVIDDYRLNIFSDDNLIDNHTVEIILLVVINQIVTKIIIDINHNVVIV